MLSEFDASGAESVEPDAEEQPQTNNALFELLSDFPGQSHEKVLGNNLTENAPKVSLIGTSIKFANLDIAY